MPKNQPHKQPCQTIRKWLQENLGQRCLAPLTGTDSRALNAAVQIVEHWAYDRNPEVVRAFGLIASRMQRSTQELAYHAIAHVVEWDDRARLWQAAGLPPIERPRICQWEPAGRTAEASTTTP